MRLFCHISEFSEGQHVPFAGASLLPVMLFLSSDRLCLWAPSGRQFREARRNGNSILGPENLLDQVRARRIQIIGRREWLTVPSSRERSKWPDAPWLDEFDDPIAEMGVADKGLLPSDRRVILADEEDGWTWAEKELELQTEKMHCARELLNSQRLPPGFLQKADRVSEDSINVNDKERFQKKARQADISFVEWLRIRSVLRDARNHEEAVKLSGCDLPVEPDTHPEAIPTIMGVRAHTKKTSSALPSNAQLLEFLRLAASISRPRDAANLEQLLQRKDRYELINEMTPFMTNPDAALELHRQLQMDPPSWLSVLNPVSGQTSVGRTFKLIGFVGLLSSILSTQLTLKPSIALLCTIIGYGKEIGEKVGKVPVSDYRGPIFPVVLGYDRKHPTYNNLEELRRRVADQFHFHR